jgi:hypothetical protein
MRFQVKWFDVITHKLTQAENYGNTRYIEAIVAAKTKYPECFAILYDSKLGVYRAINGQDGMAVHLERRS